MGYIVVIAVLSYLVGSFPTAYVLARCLRGIDIRRHGTGTVGGSNIGEQIGAWAAVAVGLADIAKGALPPLIVLRLGFDQSAAVVAGLAAIVGHDWPLFLGFKGGRGIAATLGLLLVVAPWGTLLLLASLFLGRILRLTALINGIGLALLPLIALWHAESRPLVPALLALVGITALKRVLANGEPFAEGVSPSRARLNRLLFDRDVGPKDAWGGREPRGR